MHLGNVQINTAKPHAQVLKPALTRDSSNKLSFRTEMVQGERKGAYTGLET